MEALFCHHCEVDVPLESFSRAKIQKFLNEGLSSDIYCLKHTTTSAFGDTVTGIVDVSDIGSETSESSESELTSSDYITSEDSDEEERESIDYAAWGKEWPEIHEAFREEYQNFTRADILAKLKRNKVPLGKMRHEHGNDLFESFLHELMVSRYDSLNAKDVRIPDLSRDEGVISDPSSSDEEELEESSEDSEESDLLLSPNEESDEEQQESTIASNSEGEEEDLSISNDQLKLKNKRYRETPKVKMVLPKGIYSRPSSVIARYNRSDLELIDVTEKQRLQEQILGGSLYVAQELESSDGEDCKKPRKE
jgi:hypothetical protein